MSSKKIIGLGVAGIIALILICSTIGTTPSAAGDEHSPGLKNDVEITTEVLWKDRVMYFDGNITISAGGKLIIDNTTVSFNATPTVPFALVVKSGGELWVLNNSRIDVTPPTKKQQNNFYFRVERDATLVMENSTLSNCGRSFAPWENAGLFISSNNVTIYNSAVTNNYCGLVVNGSSPLKIEGNKILKNTRYGVVLVRASCNLTNNTIEGNGEVTDDAGIVFDSSSELTLFGNNILRNTNDGIRGYGGVLTMANNNISKHASHGMFLESAKVELVSNNISSNGRGLALCYVYGNVTNNIFEGNNLGISIVGVAELKIANNRIENNLGAGIIFAASSSAEVIGNTIAGNGEDGIRCYEYSRPTIRDNIISYNGRNGIYFIRAISVELENNILTSNTKPGIEIEGGEIKNLTNNILENNNVGIKCSGGATVYKLANNTLKNGSIGIDCSSSSIKELYKNTIENFTEAIKLSHATDICSISGNDITKNNIGIYCDDTGIVSPKNKTITYNNISFSNTGIYCRYSSPKITIGNNISNNNLAIYLSGASAEVDYSNNTFENNADGILLQEWYLKVRVRADTENVKDAQVVVKDNRGTEVLNGTTSYEGYIEGWVAQYKKLNDNSVESYTPHTVAANKTYVGKASRAVPITNNTLDLEVILTIPELYLEEITVSGFLSEGQSVTVGALVVNNGTAKAENVIVRFLCNNLTLGNKTISFIAAGDSKEAAIIWIATKGNNLFEAQVDPDNLIEERANMIQNNNKTKSILINEKPLAILSAEPSEVSTYVDVTFYAGLSSDPDGIVTAYWFEFGDGANSGWTTWTVKHNYTNKGQYNCRVKVKDNFGAESDWSSAVEVRVLNRPPIANVTASVKEAYTYEEIIFYATGSYDGEEPYEQLYGEAGHRIIKYYWDFGDGIAIATTEPIVSHNYSDNGTYIVALVAQDNDFDNSTQATLSALILNRAPTALFRVTPTIASVNDKLQFNATSAKDLDGEIANYTWDFGDGSKDYGMVCEHSYTQPGIYTVTLTVSDDDGANSTSIAVVEIKRLPTWIELYYKEVYVTGAIICVAGAVFFAFRWYVEAKRREEEVKAWAEKRGIAKEEALKEKLREWAEEKKKVKTIDERIKEWAAKREADKKIREERLKEWAEKREEEKRKKELEKWAEKKREKKVK